MKPSALMTGMALILFLGAACSTTQGIAVDEDEKKVFKQEEPDSVLIADAKSKYEIVIIEPGFRTWLLSIARPEGYYSQTFLENRNQIYVMNWNQRVLLPSQYDPDLYLLPIDYDPDVNYGYEVNYKLYNYFIYFQRRYNQRLGPWLPRI